MHRPRGPCWCPALLAAGVAANLGAASPLWTSDIEAPPYVAVLVFALLAAGRADASLRLLVRVEDHLEASSPL